MTKNHKYNILTNDSLVYEMQDILDQELRACNGIGISVAIIFPTQDLWVGTSGMSNPLNSELIDRDTLFYVGSINKNFIAALILKLIEDGRLSLEDKIQDLLPPIEYINGETTICQLLNHTSGIFDYVEHPNSYDRNRLDSFDLKKVWTPDEIITTFLKKPYFPPGQGWHYSSTNYLLLMMIVESITNSTIFHEIRHRFLNPLNLRSIFFDYHETVPSEFQIAHNWFDFNQNGTLDDLMTKPREAIATWAYGEMYSNATDLVKWFDYLFRGRVISNRALKEMLSFYYPTPGEDWMEGYGLGIGEGNIGGLKYWLHTGSIFGYTSAVVHIPSINLNMAILGNDNTGSVESIGFSLVAAILNQLHTNS
ncbi:MAG: serine hydrolase domain-containing protein [Candidatus Hodarchaeota archaeon]